MYFTTLNIDPMHPASSQISALTDLRPIVSPKKMRRLHPNQFSKIALCITVAILVIFSACSQLDMEFVPTPSELRVGWAEFIIDETNLQGIYGNQDVDSVIFSYTTNIADEKSFWALMNRRLRDHHWIALPVEDKVRRYERIIPRNNKSRYHSAEEVRIAYRAETMTIFVAWVQADAFKLPEHFPTTGPEGRFARKVIWPKFNEARGR